MDLQRKMYKTISAMTAIMANPCSSDIAPGRRTIDLHTRTTARRISVGGTQI
jgi:hypothetical protein